MASDKLCKAQAELGEKIQQFLLNIKKDSPSRKTGDYVTKKRAVVDELWQEFSRRHSSILEVVDKKHSYFTKNFFKQVHEVVIEIEKILSKIEKANSVANNSQSDEEASNLATVKNPMIRRQLVKFKLLRRSMQETEENLENDTLSIRHWQNQKEDLEKQWDAIITNHEEILIQDDLEVTTYEKNNQFEELETNIKYLRNQIIEIIDTKSNTIEKTSKKITLPEIKIPIFEGSYEKWTTFYDIYINIIHENQSLSKIEKMHYLKTHVKGEAARVIQNMTISENNYEAAWNLLQKRYSNRRLILSKLIDKIINFPKIEYESSEKLKQLLDTVQECLEAIENMGISVNHWDPIITRIIATKWDIETNKLYEQSLEDPNEIQSLESMLEYIKRRFQSLESQNSAMKHKSIKNKYPTQGNNTVCKYCNGQHQIHECAKFKSLSVQERNNFIKSKKLQ